MKTSTVCVLIMALSCEVASLPTAAKKPKIHVDAGEAASQLQELMAQASGSLASAERHHEHQVQKARKAVEAILSSAAQTLGGAVSRYDAELQRSADDLQNLVNASKAILKEEEARNSGTWGNDPGMEARARLGAQADVAAREVRKAKRQHDRAVHAVLLRAESPLEDTTMHLSRRVGDLSSVVDSAKSFLETQAGKSVMDAVNKTGNVTANKTANGTKRMEALVVSLKAAMAQHKADLTVSEKSLDQAVSNSSKVMTEKIAKIENNLETAEKKEIQKVRDGAKMPPIGTKKAHKKLRTPKPVAVNKKDDAAMKSLVALLSKAFKGAKTAKA